MTIENNRSIYFLLRIVLIATPVVLLLLVLFSPHFLINDENNFTNNIPLLAKYGLSAKFLNNIQNQSPGPLYQFIYYPLHYVGIRPIREYRLVNLAFLFVFIYIVHLLMKSEGIDNTFMKSLLIFVIPVTWVLGGLVLTEIPTMFFALWSLLLFKRALLNTKYQLPLLFVSGLLLGVSIIGRMQFLLLIFTMVLLLIKNKNTGVRALLVFLGASSVLPAILILTWHGIVPPALQGAQSGTDFMYLFFSFGFTFFFMLLLYPAWYQIPRIGFYCKLLGVLLLAMFALNVLFFDIGFMPAQTLIPIVPASIRPLYVHYFPLLFPCITACLFLLHIIALLYQVSYNKDNNWNLFLLVSATLIAMTALKSSAQFSSRYPYQAMPFLLLYVEKNVKFTRGLFARALFGIVLGIVSLFLFYHQ